MRLRLSFVVLALLAAACYRESKHNGITDPGEAGILSVTVSPATIPADGASTSTVAAHIDPRTPLDKRTVMFHTTAGTFVGSSTDAGKTASLTADANGDASIVLRSSTLVESGAITVTNNNFVAEAKVDFMPVVVGNVITLTPATTQAPADGATIVPIVAQIAPNLVNRDVTFTANQGTFLPENKTSITVTANTSNRAAVDLKAPFGPTTVRVTATVSGVSTDTTISFVAAPPDSLTLTPAQFDVKAAANVVITAQLTRTPGKVTPGQTLTWTALDAGGTARGFFVNATPSTDSGTATVTWVPNDTPVNTVVTITGRVNGTNVSAQTSVRVIANS